MSLCSSDPWFQIATLDQRAWVYSQLLIPRNIRKNGELLPTSRRFAPCANPATPTNRSPPPYARLRSEPRSPKSPASCANYAMRTPSLDFLQYMEDNNLDDA